jgi:3-dehydroquinate dehydratase/shikimate dehydrogenase
MGTTARLALGVRPACRWLRALRPASIVATLGADPGASGPLDPSLSRLPPEVRCVEVRADLAGRIDTRRLRARFDGALLYALRSTAEGGRCDYPADRRRECLIAAAERYDFVELEASRDLHPAVLERISPERRVIAWHGPAADLDRLRHRFDALAAVDAGLYRLAPAAATMEQALAPVRLLASLARGDVTAYARGPVGTWTRVLAAKFGARVAFARMEIPADLEPRAGEPVPTADAAGGLAAGPAGGIAGGTAGGADSAADGELSLRRLLTDYPLDVLARAERLYGIIGGSTTASLCPLAHNIGYQSLGMPALFLPFSTGDLAESLAALGPGLDEVGLPLRGLAVVAPHKDTAVTLATRTSPSARRAGAASLLLREQAGWLGDTEAGGVLATMAGRLVEVARRRVAVIGCGGAGRAAAAGLVRAGAEVTLVNRGERRGLRAASRLDLPYVPLREFDPRHFSVLVNATPPGDAPPFPLDGLDPATVIFDLGYTREPTPLVAAALAAGHIVIDGGEMTRVELPRQFHRMTGRRLAVEIVRAAQDEFRRTGDRDECPDGRNEGGDECRDKASNAARNPARNPARNAGSNGARKVGNGAAYGAGNERRDEVTNECGNGGRSVGQGGTRR